MSASGSSLRICLLQLGDKVDFTKMMSNLEEWVERAVNKYRPQIIALPESFNHTVPVILKDVAETINEKGKTCHTLSKLSKKFGIYIVGGSIIERDGVNLYNTSTVWNPRGELIACYRKVHLCDIHWNGTNVVEVGKFSAGNDIATFEVHGFKCGVAICYDAKFDEFIKLYRKAGCDIVFFPAAFHISFGPPYWELVHRARAVDNQIFVATISPARNEIGDYMSYGHSMIIDPIGNILQKAGTGEEIVFCEIDFKAAEKIRKEVPIFTARRPDIYRRYDSIDHNKSKL